ncbi:MAG: thiamine-phosphate kinase [Terriglobales bacterium]
MQKERKWLQWVRRQAEAAAGARRPELRLGIGDDAALLRARRGWETVHTTDLFVEGVHFLRARDPALVCGRRLAARALSDLAAMGAEPLALLVSTAFPQQLPVSWARSFYRGLLRTASEAGAALVGGDCSVCPGPIVLDAVGVGQVPAGSALRRSGARRGDRIFVSGALGEAAWGRELTHGGKAAGTAAERRARARHAHPQPRWQLGLALRHRASAALDLSDGLAVDLGHLCQESGLGAEIEVDKVPAPAGLERALYGGEDYELLFTLPAGKRAPAFTGLREIGVITAKPGCWLRYGDGRRRRLLPRGWQHWQ